MFVSHFMSIMTKKHSFLKFTSFLCATVHGLCFGIKYRRVSLYDEVTFSNIWLQIESS